MVEWESKGYENRREVIKKNNLKMYLVVDFDEKCDRLWVIVSTLIE